MKSPIYIAFLGCLSCLIFMGFSNTSLHAAELVIEEDFESIAPYMPGWGGGCASEYKPAAAWKTPFTVALDTANPHAGSKAVKIVYGESAKGDRIFHSQGLPLPPDREACRIRIRFYYRLTGVPDGSLHFSVMGTNSRTKVKEWLDNQKILSALPVTDQWRSVEYEGKLNAQTQQIQLIWVNASGESRGELSIDDVSVDLVKPNK